MALKTAEFRPLFLRFSKAYRIDARLLEAVAVQESSGNPHAFRYEERIRQASYGLMQVLGSTARVMGLDPSISEAALCDPEVGVLYGTKVLADNLDRYSAASRMARNQGAYERLTMMVPFEIQVSLARFNGGGKGNPATDGKTLRNQEYADGVLKHFGDVCREVG